VTGPRYFFANVSLDIRVRHSNAAEGVDSCSIPKKVECDTFHKGTIDAQ